MRRLVELTIFYGYLSLPPSACRLGWAAAVLSVTLALRIWWLWDHRRQSQPKESFLASMGALQPFSRTMTQPWDVSRHSSSCGM